MCVFYDNPFSITRTLCRNPMRASVAFIIYYRALPAAPEELTVAIVHVHMQPQNRREIIVITRMIRPKHTTNVSSVFV